MGCCAKNYQSNEHNLDTLSKKFVIEKDDTSKL